MLDYGHFFINETTCFRLKSNFETGVSKNCKFESYYLTHITYETSNNH